MFIFFLFRDFKFFDFPFVIYKFIKWFCWIFDYLELKQRNECGDLYFMGILTYFLFCIIDILIRGFVFNIKINLNPKVLKQFP